MLDCEWDLNTSEKKLCLMGDGQADRYLTSCKNGTLWFIMCVDVATQEFKNVQLSVKIHKQVQKRCLFFPNTYLYSYLITFPNEGMRETQSSIREDEDGD